MKGQVLVEMSNTKEDMSPLDTFFRFLYKNCSYTTDTQDGGASAVSKTTLWMPLMLCCGGVLSHPLDSEKVEGARISIYDSLIAVFGMQRTTHPSDQIGFTGFQLLENLMILEVPEDLRRIVAESILRVLSSAKLLNIYMPNRGSGNLYKGYGCYWIIRPLVSS